MLKAESLLVGFRKSTGDKVLLKDLSFEVQPGTLCCIIGRNGTGKTTLLRSIIGLHPLLGGSVHLDLQLLKGYSSNQLARKLAIVTTERIKLGYLKVSELVALGRHPYTGFWGYLSAKDKDAIDHALEQAGIKNCKDKTVDKLSDGEHQKVMIARALAQETDLLFLDEPTAHLDLVNRVSVFRLLKKLCKEHGKTVVLSTHELDLGMEVADQIIMLDGEGKTYVDTPEKIKAAGLIDRIFDLNL